MNSLIKGTYNWLNKRLPIGRLLERVLLDPVPERAGWWYTFGAALFLLLIVQVITGIFLMLYYVPSWDEARNSIIFIQEQVFLGWAVRGIHYWNMVMLVLLVGIHMTRTFISGAYKVPRELTWVLGTFLLLFMVATAFTGGILRWDQSGYFDAIVGTKITSWFPVLGPWLATLWRGGEEVNPLTLERTFPLHIWVLPVALLLIATVHITLIVIQGQFGAWVNYEPEPDDAPPQTIDQIESHRKLERQVLDPNSSKVNIPVRTSWFYPNHIFREAVVALGLFLIVTIATLWFRVPVDEPINPATTTYAPASMWFFLFQDQLLLLFPGSWLIPIGATIVPAIGFVILILIPWIDNTPAFRPSLRPKTIALFFILVGVILALALLAASRVYNYGFINSRM